MPTRRTAPSSRCGVPPQSQVISCPVRIGTVAIAFIELRPNALTATASATSATCQNCAIFASPPHDNRAPLPSPTRDRISPPADPSGASSFSSIRTAGERAVGRELRMFGAASGISISTVSMGIAPNTVAIAKVAVMGGMMSRSSVKSPS